MGADSWIQTTSPTLAELASSWAWYFLDRRTVFFITGWVKARSTRTTTVFSFLSETTVPCSTRLCMLSLLLCCFRALLLAEAGLDHRDLAADNPYPGRLLELLGGALEAQVELFLLEPDELVDELVMGLGAQVGVLVDLLAGGRRRALLLFCWSSCHCRQSAMRAMTRVVMGDRKSVV